MKPQNNEPVKPDTEVAKEMNTETKADYSSLINQIEVEYQLCYLNQNDKILKNLTRLKLYNNQMRDPSAAGEPLLFTIMQTLLAAFYEDQMMVEFDGRDDGDTETSENINALARFDYGIMEKDVLDYDWIWDAAFFGRGIVDLFEFDRSSRYMCPIPERIDPGTFLHDPLAKSVRGDIKGRGSMRFGGYELYIPKYDMTPEKGYMNTAEVKGNSEIKSLLAQAQELRANAAGLNYLKNKTDDMLGENQNIAALRWFTRCKGKKCVVILTNDRKNIVKIDYFKNDRFSLIDRPFYPHSGDWDGTSVPDLVEDKQRMKAVALNLGIQAMKADLYPMYIYDEDTIKNKEDLKKFAFNKFIGVKANGGDIRGSVQPMNKANIRMDFVNWIMESLDASAQRATASPEMQQGQISSEKRTLGELNLVASKVDARYSLTTKVFGWSERRYWEQYYDLYKDNFKDGIDKKVIRLTGNKWRALTRENIIFTQDPDVSVKSRNIVENGRLKDRVLQTQYGGLVLADPNANKPFFMRNLGELNGMDKEKLDKLYPPTVDELIAEDENALLSDDKLVQVSVADIDNEHLLIHQKAAETRAKQAHIAAHKTSIIAKRKQPELFNPNGAGTPNAGIGQTALPGSIPSMSGNRIPSMTPSSEAAQGNNA